MAHGPIKRIYTGLPDHLVGRVKWVAPEYRTHEFSKSPGGFVVVVELVDRRAYGYDRVVCPGRYISAILRGTRTEEGRDFGEGDVGAVYARAEHAPSFQGVWRADSDERLDAALDKLAPSQREPCSVCDDDGAVECRRCAGTGYFGPEECSECSGRGDTPCPICSRTGLGEDLCGERPRG